MPKLIKPELKQEAIRLRIEERLSLKDIQLETKIAKSSLSLLLREHPLSEEEIRSRGIQAARNRRGKSRNPSAKRSLAQRKWIPADTVKAATANYNRGDYTNQERGKIAEAAVLFRLLLNGFATYGSVFDGDKVDWLVMVEPKHVVSVECRWMSKDRKNNTYSCRLTSTHPLKKKKVRSSGFDFVVGYLFDEDCCFVWSAADVAHLKNSVSADKAAYERWDKLKVKTANGVAGT